MKIKNQSITVRIDEDKYKRLTDLANSMERSKSYLIDNAINNYLEVNEWQVNKINKAISKANDPETKWVEAQSVRKIWEERLEH